MKDRIRELMEAQHMNQQTFANFTGINGATLSGIFTGRSRPTLNTIEAIKKKFPSINIEWLMFGHGGMFMTSNDNEASEVAGQTSAPPTNPSFSTNHNINTPTSQQHISNITVIPADDNEPAASSQRNINTANMAAEQSLFDTSRSTQSFQNNMVQSSMNNQQKPIIIEKQVQPTPPPRKVTEIRVFYDDQTWEAFVPKNK